MFEIISFYFNEVVICSIGEKMDIQYWSNTEYKQQSEIIDIGDFLARMFQFHF